VVRCQNQADVWSVEKRYSNFDSMHRRLQVSLEITLVACAPWRGCKFRVLFEDVPASIISTAAVTFDTHACVLIRIFFRIWAL
jgi:hypothetical protein